MINQIEQRSMSAWPALRSYEYDGWVLRLSGGYTKRANSINPLTSIEEGKIPIETKITYCKELFEKEGLPVVYKLTNSSQNNLLDECLQDKGYQKIDTTSVRVLNLDSLSFEHNNEVIIEKDLSDRWLKGYVKSNHISEEIAQNLLEPMLNKIVGKTIYVSIMVGGQAVAFGYGVVDQGYVGLFDILVDKQFRGLGHSKKIMNTILSQAKDLGADKAYLQVVVGNHIAESLYHKLGFREVYQYWYRKL